MKVRGCNYRESRKGRSFTTRPGIGGATCTAHLQCSRCPAKLSQNIRCDATPRQIDAKFQHVGWRLDPHVCPNCLRKPKETNMSSRPSPAAMKAQGKMFQLLTLHFDVDKGTFEAGWDDQRIARETDLSKDIVTDYRRTCFGEIKEPAELAALRTDINAIEALQSEANAGVAQAVAELRSKLASVAQKFSA
jgi:hypothetical protein